MNQELELVLGADFTTLDEKLEDVSLKDVPQKLISISKKMTSDHLKPLEESNRTVSQLALFDRKAVLLGKHIEYVNQLRNRLKNGYQHFAAIENLLLNSRDSSAGDGGQLSKESLSSKKDLPTKERSPPSAKEPSKERQKTGSNKSSLQQTDKSHLLLPSELIDLDQKEFIVYLKKILENEQNPLDWKRILCIYSVMKEPLNADTIKLLKNILITKEAQHEITNFTVLIEKIIEKNGFQAGTKFVSLRSLINKIGLNELDEQKYPTVNCIATNPKRLLIFISGGISFNELNLVKKANATTTTDTVLISDSILYPRLFLDTLIN